MESKAKSQRVAAPTARGRGSADGRKPPRVPAGLTLRAIRTCVTLEAPTAVSNAVSLVTAQVRAAGLDSCGGKRRSNRHGEAHLSARQQPGHGAHRTPWPKPHPAAPRHLRFQKGAPRARAAPSSALGASSNGCVCGVETERRHPRPARAGTPATSPGRAGACWTQLVAFSGVVGGGLVRERSAALPRKAKKLTLPNADSALQACEQSGRDGKSIGSLLLGLRGRRCRQSGATRELHNRSLRAGLQSRDVSAAGRSGHLDSCLRRDLPSRHPRRDPKRRVHPDMPRRHVCGPVHRFLPNRLRVPPRIR